MLTLNLQYNLNYYLIVLSTLDILEDYAHPSLVYKDTNRNMQLDIFIPSLSLAFEYQGAHHYQDIYYFGAYARDTEIRDRQKREACRVANITLIEVPHWWDYQK